MSALSHFFWEMSSYPRSRFVKSAPTTEIGTERPRMGRARQQAVRIGADLTLRTQTLAKRRSTSHCNHPYRILKNTVLRKEGGISGHGVCQASQGEPCRFVAGRQSACRYQSSARYPLGYGARWFSGIVAEHADGIRSMASAAEVSAEDSTAGCMIPRSAPGRNRTCDLALRRHSLYPLSYRGQDFQAGQNASGRKDGGGEGDRTLDLRIANATLSQLSYSPKKGPEY
jgi:hypothetical protein